jgi:hypothetical protein
MLTKPNSNTEPKGITAGMTAAATNGDLTIATEESAMLLVFSNANSSNR